MFQLLLLALFLIIVSAELCPGTTTSFPPDSTTSDSDPVRKTCADDWANRLHEACNHHHSTSKNLSNNCSGDLMIKCCSEGCRDSEIIACFCPPMSLMEIFS